MRGRLGVTSLVLAATLLAAAPGIVAGQAIDVAPDTVVKAAFLYNFAKFTEWPALPPAAFIAVCVVGDDAIAAALVATVHGQKISGDTLNVLRPQDSATWRPATCSSSQAPTLDDPRKPWARSRSWRF